MKTQIIKEQEKVAIETPETEDKPAKGKERIRKANAVSQSSEGKGEEKKRKEAEAEQIDSEAEVAQSESERKDERERLIAAWSRDFVKQSPRVVAVELTLHDWTIFSSITVSEFYGLGKC